MTAFHSLLNTYRQAAQTEREKGTYFEELFCTYLGYLHSEVGSQI